jgi:cell division septation protein DedD
MGLRRILKKKTRFTIRKPVARAAPPEKHAPKNGWLTIAVAGGLLAAFVLGFINMRLLRDPAVGGRAFWSSAAGHGTYDRKSDERSASQQGLRESGHVRPEVTFYSKLVAPDEQERTPNPPEEMKEAVVAPEAQLPKQRDASRSREKRSEAERKVAHSRDVGDYGAVSQPIIPPSAESGSKKYTVQVGAFSQPGIAQQWAARWKARGYDVTLKPVARSDGIIYRLYLGRFATEGEADELVRRLKTKEGISALRLVVRD